MQNTGSSKNRFVATPLLTKKLCFVKLFVLKPKTLRLNKKHNLKSGNSKDKKKGFERKTRQETQKRENIDEEKQLPLNILMLFLSRNKSKEERKGKKETKTRNQNKAKKKDKKEERKKRRKERDR